jgi:hypothetical protein
LKAIPDYQQCSPQFGGAGQKIKKQVVAVSLRLIISLNEAGNLFSVHRCTCPAEFREMMDNHSVGYLLLSRAIKQTNDNGGVFMPTFYDL